MHFIINDFNLYYEVYGNSKDCLLILPGWGNNRKTFYHVISYLKDYFTIYIIDYPGFGDSSFPNRDLWMEDYAQLIRDFIIVHHLEHANLIAHSFGGRIFSILKGCYKIPFDKIILMDIAGIKPKKNLRQKMKQYIYKFLKKCGWMLPKKWRISYWNFLISKFGSNDLKELSSNIRNTFVHIVNEDLEENFKKISGDILLLWGEKDTSTPLSDGKRIANDIKGSSLITLKNCHHFPYLENPIGVKNIILSYLLSTKKK